MKKFVSIEAIVVLLAVCITAGLSARLYATLSCNGYTPTLGNCGVEYVCLGRSDTLCEMSYGHYHEDNAGIGCQSGEIHNYCAQLPEPFDPDDDTPYMNCTCEFFCDWDPVGMKCDKDVPHNDGNGDHVCGRQLRHDSQICNAPP